MKGFLGCYYQCDVPPETIKNLLILSVNKIGCICTCKKCATTTRKIFVFFLGGPPQLGVRFQAGGPTQYNQACKLSRKLFLFLSCIWDLVGYNYSWTLAGEYLLSPG